MMTSMSSYTRAGPLKRSILLFWAVWITMVVIMNVFDAIKALGLLPGDWPLASGNYEAIVKAASVYHAPNWLDFLLFLGAVGWEMVCALLFWRAWELFSHGRTTRWPAVYLAFTSIFGLFAAFILADELFHTYGIEGDHRGITVLALASVLVLTLLPDRLPER
jgi:hypothetical protein